MPAILIRHLLRFQALMTWIHGIRQQLEADFSTNSLRARFAKGMFWLVLGSSVRQGVNLLLFMLVGRILGVTTFGKLAVVQSTALMLAEVGQMGIGLSTTRYVASLRTKEPERAGRLIGFSLIFTCMSALVVCLVVLASSSWLGETVLKGSNLTLELRLACGFIIFEMINVIQIRALVGLEAFRSTAVLHFSRAALLPPLMVFGAYHGGLAGTITALIVGSAIICVVGQNILRKECKRLGISISYSQTWEERGILRMSFYVWISNLLMRPTTWLTGILLARQPSGLSELGLFNAADRLKNAVLFAPFMISEAALPILANLHSTGDRRHFTRALISSGILAMCTTGIGAIAFVALSDQFMSWYGAEFVEGSEVLRILAIGCVAYSVWIVAAAGLWALGKSRQMLTLDAIQAFILVSLCLAGMAVSAQTLALAHAISWIVASISSLAVLFGFCSRFWPTDHLAHP